MPASPSQRPAREAVFGAIILDEFPAHRASGITSRIFQEHGLDGRLRPVEHLRLNMFGAWEYSELEDEGLGSLMHGCESVAASMKSFKMRLNGAMSLRAEPHRSAPLVLVSGDTIPELDGFYRTLHMQWVKLGLASGKVPRFTPHVTTAYSMKRLDPQPIDPISWIVRDLVLLRSFVGRTGYEELGRWSFDG